MILYTLEANAKVCEQIVVTYGPLNAQTFADVATFKARLSDLLPLASISQQLLLPSSARVKTTPRSRRFLNDAIVEVLSTGCVVDKMK
jgi:hypothetical protein